MKIHTLILGVTLCVGAPLPTPAEPSALAHYLAAAKNNNEALQAAAIDIEAANAQLGYADALPDPALKYAYFGESVETRVGPQEQKIGLVQAVPFFGKRALRRKAAEAVVTGTRAQHQSYERSLIHEVTTAYYELAYLDRSVAITSEIIDLVSQFEQVAQARVRAGGPLAEVLKAQVELGNLENKLASTEAARKPLQARLNTAIGAASGAALPWPIEPPSGETRTLDPAQLVLGLADHPSLKIIDARRAQARENTAQARRARLPDFQLGVEYIQTGEARGVDVADSGTDPWIASIGLTLPWWNGKNNARIDQAEKQQSALALRHTAQERALAQALEQAVYTYENALRKQTLYRETLIPRGEQSLSLAQEAYTAATGSFLDLIDAERQLLEFKLNLERALADRAIAQSSIYNLTGTEPNHDQP